MSLFSVLLSMLVAVFPGLAPHGDADGSVVIPLRQETIADEAPLPPVIGPAGRPIVVIDPGHGGHDPGATSPFTGTREKELTLRLARAIRDELVASGRVRVALTRNDDRYLPHENRFGIAQKLKAGLFISVHADAAPANDGARGATIYTLSEVASDREAAILAEGENRAGSIGGVEMEGQDSSVSRILFDLALRESMETSAEFAQLLRREASEFFPFRPEYHRFASLLVLKAPDVPSILFESGYLTNAADAAYIQSEEGQKQIATGMRRAIETHFARQLVPTSRI